MDVWRDDLLFLTPDFGEVDDNTNNNGVELPPSPSSENTLYYNDHAVSSFADTVDLKTEQVSLGTEQASLSGSDNKAAKRKNAKSAEEKKRSNAEYCRRHREKRKLEASKLRNRNEELEAEQELFRERIGDLQNQVQCLRNEGEIDYTLENELLRLEIRRHKRFLSSLLQVTNDIPEGDREEQFRKLRSGIDSGISQLVGLIYSSTRDPSWKRGKDIIKPPDRFAHPGSVKMYYQYLPLGTTVETATRVNVRFDFGIFPNCTCEDVLKAQWLPLSNVEYQRKMNDIMSKEDGLSRESCEILPPALKQVMENIQKDDALAAIKTSTRKDGKLMWEDAKVSSHSKREIYPWLCRMKDDDGDGESASQASSDGYITFSVSVKQSPDGSSLELANSFTVGSFNYQAPGAVSPGVVGGMVVSYALKNGVVVDAGFKLIGEDGSLNEKYKDQMLVIMLAYERSWVNQ